MTVRVAAAVLALTSCASWGIQLPPSQHPERLCKSGKFTAESTHYNTAWGRTLTWRKDFEVPINPPTATILLFWSQSCEQCAPAFQHLLGAARQSMERDATHLIPVLVVADDEQLDLDQVDLVLRRWGVNLSLSEHATTWEYYGRGVRGPEIAPYYVIDRGKQLMGRFGLQQLPATVVLDSEGDVRWIGQEGSYDPSTFMVAHKSTMKLCPKR